jgi:hypothetical protein
MHDRLEFFSKKRGGWVRAGEDSTKRGSIAEDAARAQIKQELDAEAKAAKRSTKADRLSDWERLPHQNTRGQGFDDVVVEFRGDPPTAKIRIIEVKDYPNRNIQTGQMSAIRENLETNWRELETSIKNAANKTAAARPEPYKSMSQAQMDALVLAVKNKQVRIELWLTQSTSTPAEGSRSNSVLAKLRGEVKDVFDGKDVLDTKHPRAIDQKHVDEAAAAKGNTQ